MQINGKFLCDYCFEEITSEPCPVCGFAHSGYQPEVGVLPVGTLLKGRYHIGKVLGKGGFGVTYKAYDDKENMLVAVKEYYPNGMAHRDTGTTQVSVGDKTLSMDFQSGAEKFCEEAKTISRFNGNPNIMGVYNFFFENGTAYFVMEYLDGMDLKHYIQLQGGKLTQENVVHIARVVSDALLITHSMNVLHRDISPDNIYITGDGHIKLIDFGAARQVMSQQSKSLSVILKQGFAPLEQYQRKGKQGAWTDIYALGATLYYALTGEVPDDATERLEDPDLGKAEDYGVDTELWQVIDKCMAVKISDRYEATTDLKKDLNKLTIKEEELAKPPQAVEKVQPAAAAPAQSNDDRTVAMDPQTAGPVQNDQTIAMDPVSAQLETYAISAGWMPVGMDLPSAALTQAAGNTAAPQSHSNIGETVAVNVATPQPQRSIGETVAINTAAPAPQPSPQPVPASPAPSAPNLNRKINKLAIAIAACSLAALLITLVVVLTKHDSGSNYASNRPANSAASATPRPTSAPKPTSTPKPTPAPDPEPVFALDSLLIYELPDGYYLDDVWENYSEGTDLYSFVNQYDAESNFQLFVIQGRDLADFYLAYSDYYDIEEIQVDGYDALLIETALFIKPKDTLFWFLWSYEADINGFQEWLFESDSIVYR